ncbi:acylneuraminate cytidylyltransferase family protein [bacterium]|nr:acylneuraminate cytidylyltransferase family protein [bacterium]
MGAKKERSIFYFKNFSDSQYQARRKPTGIILKVKTGMKKTKKKIKIIAIIPARSNSKRVPHKNIKMFLGKPLIYWTITAAKESNCLDRIILNTDSPKIAKVGERYGAEVQFIRPKYLAKNTTTSLDVVRHHMLWLKKHENYIPDWVILLEPSSPGRQPFHIKEVVKILKSEKNIDSLVGISVVPGHYNPLKILRRNKNGLVTRYYDGQQVKCLIHRNQDLPTLYFINSSIYAFKIKNILDDPPSLWGERVFGYVMGIEYSMDIDTPDDWIIAEAKMKALKKKRKLIKDL